MARDLTSTVQTETQQPVVRPEVFLELDFPSALVWFWTGFGTKIMDGKSFTGVGDFGIPPEIDESDALSPKMVEFTLTGIPSTSISATQTEKYRGRAVRSWFAFLDSSGNIITDPYLWFIGRMDTMSVRESGETADISLTAEDCMVDLNRPRTSRYTPAEQERLYPGDTSMRYVARLSEKPIYWMSAPPSPVAGANGGGLPIESGKMQFRKAGG